MLLDACPRCRRPLRLGVHVCTACGQRLSPTVGADALVACFRRLRGA